jgi:hypothetical protein
MIKQKQLKLNTIWFLGKNNLSYQPPLAFFVLLMEGIYFTKI